MLFDKTDLYEEDEYIKTEDIPQILQNFLKWLKVNGDVETSVDTLADFRVAEVYDNFHVMEKIFGEFVVGSTDLSADELNTEVKEQLKSLQELINEGKEFNLQITEYIKSATETFNTFNMAFTEKDGEPQRLENVPLLRHCQVPGCNNELAHWQHHAAKYCISCQESGAVKRMYNKRANAKFRT